MNKLSGVVSAFTVQEPPLDPHILTKTSRIQLLYGAWVNMAQLAIGLAFGFAGIQIPMLLKPDSEIHLTVDDASWIVSAVPLMVPLGCVISGFLMDWIGRGHTLIYCQVPMFVGWLYTSLSKTANDVIIARAITGVGCGMAMGPSRAYGTEIALPNMRGVIGAFPSLAVSLGITFTAALGKFFKWQVVCYICCFFTFLCFCSFIFLPETPYFILQTKTMEDARANLTLFRGPLYKIDKEMKELIDFKQENNLRKLTFRKSLGMLFSKAACKPFTLIMIYQLIAQSAGISIILFWTTDLLERTRTSIELHTGNILIGVTRVLSGMFTSVLLYRFGRRPLALISAFGVTIVCCAFGITLMSKEKTSTTPQMCLMLYVVFGNLGYYTLPFLMAFELYPLQVRGVLGGATISITSLMVFASTKLEPFLLETLGVANTFITFGLFSFIGCIFIFFFLPETKDLTLQEIEEYYKDMRPTLSSQRRLESLNQFDENRGRSKSSKRIKKDLDRLRKSSNPAMLSHLEEQKKLAQLIEKEIEEQLNLSSTKKELSSTLEREEGKYHESIKSTDAKKYEEQGQENKKSTGIKIYEEKDRESTESKKTRGITFDETKKVIEDNVSTKSTKPTDNKSIKSSLKVIYEQNKDKKDQIKKDTLIDEKRDEAIPEDGMKDKETSKEEKRDDETPKDEMRDGQTPKDEKRDEETPKDEMRDGQTPKDEKRDEETPKDEMRDGQTPKDEKRDEETSKDEKIDEETSKKSTDDKSVKSTLNIIYENTKDKKDKTKKDTLIDVKRGEATPKDGMKDKETSKEENRDDETPKDEKKDEETPKKSTDNKSTKSTLNVIYEYIKDKKFKTKKDTLIDEKRDEETPEDEKIDEETPKKSTDNKSTRSTLNVIYEYIKGKKDKTKKDTLILGAKRDEATPEDEMRVKETSKNEKRDEETPKDEKKDEETPKDEKKDKETPKDEKKDKETPKDEKKDKETPKDDNQPSTSKKNAE